MKRVLILMGRYLPGHRDGGPLRTIANVVEALGDEYRFFIACLDRDHGDEAPYPGVRVNEWNRVGKAEVYYVPPGGFSDALLLKLAEGMDSVYLCSFYEDYGYRMLLLKKSGRIRIPVTVASMGVFSKEALAQKSVKKKLFINGCRLAGLFRNVTWSVTSELEAADLKRVLGDGARCVVAEDLPRGSIPGRRKRTEHDVLRAVFLSRICAHKGLDVAIRAIRDSGVPCCFTVCGPVQEPDYWEDCRKALDGMDWRYLGDIPGEQVQEILSEQDVLLLPTRSENYGHVIFEAMSVGCVPIVSDQTPWGILAERGAGYVVRRDVGQFAHALSEFAALERKEQDAMADRAVLLAEEKLEQSKRQTGYKTIFDLSAEDV